MSWQGRGYEVPGAFVALLLAQRFERTTGGASPDDPLFIAPSGPKSGTVGPTVPMTGYALQKALRTVARETGVLVTTEYSARPQNTDAHNWAYRRGVSVIALRTAGNDIELAA